MQVLQRARSQGHADPDAGIVGEQQFACIVVLRRQCVLEAVRQVVVGKPDLVAEDDLGVGQSVGDGAGADVGTDQAGVQHEQLDEGGKTALPCLQDHVLIVHLTIQGLLRRVHLELDAAALLVGDEVEIIQPPPPFGELIACCERKRVHSVASPLA
jgi:hypothetical protein